MSKAEFERMGTEVQGRNGDGLTANCDPGRLSGAYALALS